MVAGGTGDGVICGIECVWVVLSIVENMVVAENVQSKLETGTARQWIAGSEWTFSRDSQEVTNNVSMRASKPINGG